MGAGRRHTAPLPLWGGYLCLDFANTAGWHASTQPEEWLTSYADLIAWSRHAGALSAAEGQHLAHAAAERPAEARAVRAWAIAVREALYQLFAALAAGRGPHCVERGTRTGPRACPGGPDGGTTRWPSIARSGWWRARRPACSPRAR